ncbi:MAG: ACT domain-containing protein [Thermoplasmata archaeon]|nr:ACT domain-containing protein [Thermoplasmata archaeon]
MDIIDGWFDGYPSQEKVAKLLLESGMRVEAGRAYCGNVEQGDSAIGRACGVDRRVVRTTLERISATPELDAIFSKLRSTLSMVDLASEIGCSAMVINPTDSTMPGILADITGVLYKHGVSVRQAMVDDSGDEGEAVLLVVVYGRIPPGAIPDLKACRGVDSVLLK